MSIPLALKQKLLQLHSKLPEGRRDVFATRIGHRLKDVATSKTVTYGVCGAAIGAALEALPGFETITGIDDWVEVGAALGAWVGLAKDEEERAERERIRRIIDEEIQNALS